MKLDKEEHRVMLLELLTSQSISIPFAFVDAVVELRETVKAATVEPTLKAEP